MTFNTNRLNLPAMVNNQLKPESKQGFFQSFLFNRQKEQHLLKGSTVNDSLNNLMVSVHSKIKNRGPHKTASPSIPEALAEILPKSQPSSSPILSAQSKPAQQPKIGKQNLTYNNGKQRRASISQMKASLALKTQQRMRRMIANATGNFTTQKRIKEIVRQKAELEDMLHHQKKLELDHMRIKAEVQTIKSCWNTIRENVDSSLRKLDTNLKVNPASGRKRSTACSSKSTMSPANLKVTSKRSSSPSKAKKK